MTAERPLERALTSIRLEHRGGALRGWEYRPASAPSAAGGSVLFVHGFGDSSIGPRQLFVQAATALTDTGLTVRSYDRLGHGTSDGRFADISIGDEVAQVVTMIRAFSADHGAPIDVVAHSLGAVESAMAAARVPDLVRSLTLWSPAGVVVDDIAVHDTIQGQPLAPVRDRGWFDFGGTALGRGFVDEVRDGLDVYAQARGYDGPVDVLHGTADEIVPVEYGRRYGELLSGATFTAVEGADHVWSSVPWREQLVDRLLDRVRERSGR
ncbi:lysophospholipase [Curtobacterium flaccumfaciens pv. flaccumfaciens]|uniref:alpha/beta hydrolase n=1 Tax=Curtobacterium TaxID=2034 RepID=UPI00217F0837|nr:lysophospholipase [Curtobacterium flaccumfaciens]MCS6553961.1 lysophospholipase [Curtobacterium flaccumfaciens]MCS6582354.1 lysophospholipase [Curtobacterium flaccumfaciens pv. beticola]QYI97954.1 lysophospholipase [Curtobacterium flaccumfaciens pv. flaccumfaciens]UXN22255.1 lysophospholipase [Curtobacterium flaccumfaciens pv. flaccumfaciens]